MPTHKTPGVYVEEVSTLAPSVVGVATAIPAFVGYTEKRPSADPVKISSLLDYERGFGKGCKLTYDSGLKGQEYVMHESVRLYFENGGGVCYIVSAGTDYPTANSEDYKEPINLLEAVDEVTLVVCPDAAMLLKGSALGSVQQAMLKHCGKMKDRIAILDVPNDGVEDFRNNVSSNSLSYGAAYYPLLKSSYNADIDFVEVMKALAPEIMGATNDSAVAEIATDSDSVKSLKKACKVALDVKSKAVLGEEDILRIKAAKANCPGYAAKLAELQDAASLITPSGAVAGAIVATDNNVGVWQAPANIGLASIKAVSKNLTNDDQESLNVDENGKSINAIRMFPGKGILVWGARTLDGNSNEWKYIPVRRLFNYVEESIQKSTFWAVFQPNDANTWIKLKCQISNFLTNLWKDGALAGATPEDAFFVNVGLGSTMDSQDILEGRLIINIGIAAVRPAEFIELRFTHKVQQ